MTAPPNETPPAIRLADLAGALVRPILIPGSTRACNPSIAAAEAGFRAIVRTVNYELDDAGAYVSLPDGRYMTWNWVADFDRDLRLTGFQPMDDAAYRTDDRYRGGFEDCRLFAWKGAWWFSATVVTGYGPLQSRIVLCRLDGARVAECHPLPAPTQSVTEKNWMPYVDGAALGWIYRIDPTELVRHREGDVPLHEATGDAGTLHGWSGSSQCVRYGRNWLCVVHRRIARPQGVFYEHRFVELNDGFRIHRMSERWIFERDVIEFCAGLCLADGHAILSYGILDRQARLMRIRLSAVEDMLRPV